MVTTVHLTTKSVLEVLSTVFVVVGGVGDKIRGIDNREEGRRVATVLYTVQYIHSELLTKETQISQPTLISKR